MSDRDALLQIKAIVDQQLAAIAPPSTSTTQVKAGGDLQAAINAAVAGDTIAVDPGDYAPVTIPKPLTLATTAQLPSRRIVASDSPGLFARIAATGVPAVTALAPAVLQGFRVTRSDNAPPVIAIRGEWSKTGVLSINQCWALGLTLGNRRGVEMNGSTILSQSRVENMWCAGQDAQAVSGWTSAGPFTIDDCYLEGSTETVLFGGADPVDQAHQPKNLTIRKCLVSKQLAWRNTRQLVKTTLELKNIDGFLIEDNVFEYAWVDEQTGFLLTLTPRNQGGTAPYSTVANGVIQRNLFRHGAGGINMLGNDNLAPSQRMSNIQLLNNRFEDVDGSVYGGNGRLCQIVAGPDAITLDHNTFSGQNLNSFLYFANFKDVQRCTNFTYTNNLAAEGNYGIFGDNTTVGAPSVALFAPGAVWQNIAVLKQAPRTIAYPAGTQYVADEALGVAIDAGATGYPTAA